MTMQIQNAFGWYRGANHSSIFLELKQSDPSSMKSSKVETVGTKSHLSTTCSYHSSSHGSTFTFHSCEPARYCVKDVCVL